MTLNPKPLDQNRALGLITLPSGPCFAKKTSSFVTLYIENEKSGLETLRPGRDGTLHLTKTNSNPKEPNYDT